MSHAEQPIVVRFAPEITTKSRRTRRRFQNILQHNIEDALRRHGLPFTLAPKWGRMVIESPARDDVLGVLPRVFGISSFSPVEAVAEVDLEAIARVGRATYASRIDGRRYAVRAKKLGTHPISRMAVETELGRALNPYGKVDLERPEITVGVEIFGDRAYFATVRHAGPEGLPAGVQDKAVVLISGGFDSAVAAWRIMRRGVGVDYVFCNLGGSAYERMVLQLTGLLFKSWSFGLRPRLHVVDFAPLVAAFRRDTEAAYWQVILKRLMYRAASRIAREQHAKAIVTGEAIGQVSSQTIANLHAIERAAAVPVLRPLIGMDKAEIMADARRIGTAALSERVREYCALGKDRPVVACRPARLDREEAKLDLDLLERLVTERKVIDLERVDPAQRQTPYLFKDEIPEDAIIIDCQPRHLYEKWHVPDARNHDLDQLLERYRELDKDRTYLLYCTYGTLTPLLAELMQQSGYEAYAFDGGVAALKRHLEERGH